MYKYTLAFIKRDNQILLLNRQKSPWLGSWNGVGGKIDDNEKPIECIKREIKEETNIDVPLEQIIDKGTITWDENNNEFSGLHLFVVVLPKDYKYDTPIKTVEGILDWKDMSWIMNKENTGVAYNMPHFIEGIFLESDRFSYNCTYTNEELVCITKEAL